MDTSEVQDLVADLGENLDDLESALTPLINTALSASTSKLPLLDKAKLYVLATYAIESVLFSYLKINGTDVAQHPIAQELTRVKSYFQKVKEAEQGPAQRTATLDKDAAARFIKHGLSGNDKFDQARQEKLAAEKAGAKRKADELEASAQWGNQNRFAGAAKRLKADESTVTVVKGDEDDNEDDGGRAGSAREQTKEEKKAAKHQRRMERKQAKQSPVDESASAGQGEISAPAGTSKKSKKAPKGSHEAFRALLDEGDDGEDKSEGKGKKKRKKRSEVQLAMEDSRANEMK